MLIGIQKTADLQDVVLIVINMLILILLLRLLINTLRIVNNSLLFLLASFLASNHIRWSFLRTTILWTLRCLFDDSQITRIRRVVLLPIILSNSINSLLWLFLSLTHFRRSLPFGHNKYINSLHNNKPNKINKTILQKIIITTILLL